MNRLKQVIYPWILALLLCAFILPTLVQAREETIAYTLQNLSFGSFFRIGSGGTITISNNGVRSTSGGIISANQMGQYHPAIIEVEGAINSVVDIIHEADIPLIGSNGGTASLHLENASSGSPFILTNKSTSRKDVGILQVNIGGTLIVGSSNSCPIGDYYGAFLVTFIQE